MIAMALACRPKLLIADEPTTALDVTIQAQILDLLMRERRDNGMGLVLITHDMGVVAETADRVIVQYAGQQMETNGTRELFADPHHPYTAALLAALPERANGRRLPAIPGVVPGPFDRPRGCVFSPRCAYVFDACHDAEPPPAAPALGRARCPDAAGRRDSERARAARGGLVSAILEARDLTRDYSVSRGAFRSRATIKALAGVSFSLQAGRTLAVVGESGSRQIDAGAAPHLDRKSDRRLAPDRRRGCRARERGDEAAPPAGNPDRVPEPVWLAQPAPDDRQGARGAAARQHGP